MFLSPKKKVGSPVSVKGVRGDFLTTLMMYIGGALFFTLLILMFPLAWFIQLFCIGFTIIFLIYKFNELKKLSKGDIYSQTKKYSRKLVFISSKPISKTWQKKKK